MFDRSQLTASCADSFITSPSCPVRVISPIPDPPSLPLSMRLASTYMISPPVRVQARPAATPGLFNSWALSRSYRIGPESNNIQWCICLRQAQHHSTKPHAFRRFRDSSKVEKTTGKQNCTHTAEARISSQSRNTQTWASRKGRMILFTDLK